MISVAIVGAGPAGLSAAISAAETARAQGIPTNVVIFEKNPEPGRKLLLTGSGQCNLTNHGSESGFGDPEQFLSHYGSREQSRFLRTAFYSFTSIETMDFFSDMGVSITVKDDGKVFPASLRASDVLEALIHRCKISGIQISYSSPVKKIVQHRNGFSLQTSQPKLPSQSKKKEGVEKMFFQKVILAAGGSTYPFTGSSGDGFLLSGSLGHTIIPPKPALSGVIVSQHSLSALSGISFENIVMSIWRDGKKVMSTAGDMVITHTGFSGPVVVNNSRSIEKLDELVFDFSFQGKDFIQKLQEKIQQNGTSQISTVVQNCGIPKRLTDKILEFSGIDSTGKCAEISRKNLRTIAESCTSWKHTVASAGKFSNAMVTAGGVSLKEVNSGTMQSRIIPGLFFAGEVLDIDGKTGGYNLQAAFSTGMLAGKGAANCLDYQSMGK